MRRSSLTASRLLNHQRTPPSFVMYRAVWNVLNTGEPRITNFGNTGISKKYWWLNYKNLFGKTYLSFSCSFFILWAGLASFPPFPWSRKTSYSLILSLLVIIIVFWIGGPFINFVKLDQFEWSLKFHEELHSLSVLRHWLSLCDN